MRLINLKQLRKKIIIMANEKKSIKERAAGAWKFVNDTEAIDNKINSILPTRKRSKKK